MTTDLTGLEQRLSFLHAHPDDETIATGALIAHLVETGHDVTLLTASRGEQGEVVPGPLSHLAGSDALIDVREQELASALQILGVRRHTFLGDPPARVGSPRRYRDSGMVWVEEGLAGPAPDMPSDAFCAADEAEIAADITAWLVSTNAQALVTYDSDGGYGHPDHVRCHRIGTQAAQDLGLAVHHIIHEPESGALWWDLEHLQPLLKQALGAHATQLSVEGDNIRHSGGQLEPIRASVGLRRYV